MTIPTHPDSAAHVDKILGLVPVTLRFDKEAWKKIKKKAKKKGLIPQAYIRKVLLKKL